MKAVAITPRCEECGETWMADDERRWQSHRVDVEPHDEPAVAFWCPTCARREFG